MLTEEKFEQLFREHYKSMMHYAMRYVNDSDTAGDIVQEVFINLWKIKEEFTPRESMKSYLLSAVYYKSLNFLKKEKQKILSSCDDSSLNIFDEFRVFCIDNETAITTPVFPDESLSIIKAAIDDLPDQCKRVFILSRKLGLKNKEIADFLNISVKVVEKHISKALLILRQALKEK
jgi:RNA polymerase sigma-70 factor (family 1)